MQAPRGCLESDEQIRKAESSFLIEMTSTWHESARDRRIIRLEDDDSLEEGKDTLGWAG